MLIEEKFKDKVIKFCALKNIPIERGFIPQKYAGEISEFIKNSLDKERQTTKRLEENLQSRLNFSIKSVIHKLSGMVIEYPIETYLWDALEREELFYMARKQYEIGPYRIDIAFPVCKLAIECDGAEYHRANITQLERDQKRDKYLARKGWRTIRFSGIEIRRDINFCITKTKECLGDFAAKKAGVKL